VPYWDVVLRGFGLPSSTTFRSAWRSTSCRRLLPRDVIEKPQVSLYEKISTGIFFGSVACLIFLMASSERRTARSGHTGSWMLAVLVAVFSISNTCARTSRSRRDLFAASGARSKRIRDDLLPYATARHARIMIACSRHRSSTAWERCCSTSALERRRMILMSYLFGWLLGTGLPRPQLTSSAHDHRAADDETRINPWVAHFFVFFLSVWGELSPPTSLSAAVCARIRNASFMRTMWEALKICLPITIMTFAIFTRSELY